MKSINKKILRGLCESQQSSDTLKLFSDNFKRDSFYKSGISGNLLGTYSRVDTDKSIVYVRVVRGTLPKEWNKEKTFYNNNASFDELKSMYFEYLTGDNNSEVIYGFDEKASYAEQLAFFTPNSDIKKCKMNIVRLSNSDWKHGNKPEPTELINFEVETIMTYEFNRIKTHFDNENELKEVERIYKEEVPNINKQLLPKIKKIFDSKWKVESDEIDHGGSSKVLTLKGKNGVEFKRQHSYSDHSYDFFTLFINGNNKWYVSDENSNEADFIELVAWNLSYGIARGEFDLETFNI